MNFPIQKMHAGHIGQYVEVIGPEGIDRGLLTHTRARVQKTEVPTKRGVITERRYVFDVELDGKPIKTSPGSTFRFISREAATA